ncbi:Insulin-like growth factor binding protein, N-terminal [Phytophthora cinnamomi]|uniref:Insulin-like growth factor binding protein, N-terminal n=1 Tax=Phytophthora cinnamomi TaxID=4785 RepID=UPI00355A72F1|nr:Insulin-like growth factor binding protein, N-terminal [Phytophthora cinnamomi]
MVCLSVGDGLLFDLSVPRSYPIYMKDSMLNTNPSFDYGAFRALATKVNANASTVSAFAFSFTEPGTYVFGNSLNGAAQTIVVVMKSGTSCPTEAAIVPLNEKNLITVSAKRRTNDLILAPDWALIVGLLGGLFGVVMAVIAGLYYFRAKSWTNTAVKSISGYRAKSKQVSLSAMHSKGTVAVNTGDVSVGDGSLLATEPTTTGMKQLHLGGQEATQGNSMEYHADLGRWDEEDLDLRELVDRLQFHHEAVTKSFEDQKGDVKQLIQHLQAEAIELKRLFVNALVASDLMSGPSLNATKENHELPSSAGTNEVPEELPLSTISGRPRSRSVAGKEKFLLENLERDLQERQRFEQKKGDMLGSVSAGLREIEGWSTQLAELTGAMVQEMSSPIDEAVPERTSTSEETCLERTRMVLDDLKRLLGSDPMTQTSSSLIHLAEAEKGRREVGNFVLEASQRYFTPQCSAAGPASTPDPADSDIAVQKLLELHHEVEKAQNKEDEALFGPLPTLQKFGAALPQVIATLDDLEANFRHELDAVREEQNPVKERNVQAQMQSRLSKLLKEVAAGAKKVNEKLGKEAPRALKLQLGAQNAEDALSRAVGSAKEQWKIADHDQKDRVATALAKEAEESRLNAPKPSTPSAEDDAATKLRDDTLFQIKELLVGLTTLLRTSGVPSIGQPDQSGIAAFGDTPTKFVDAHALPEAKRKIESDAKQSADDYASALDVNFPQLSAVEKERLLDDFAADLRKIQSSVSVEATRTQAELATRQAATEVLREAQKAQVQRREQEDADVLKAQHDVEEQSLESQFREEELAIEQEYLQELSSLEMEFGSAGDEAGGDFTEPPEDMDLIADFDTSIVGDESLPPGLMETEDTAEEDEIAHPPIPGDDNADIIAQLNDVYSQAWNDRVRILAMEDALRKEQLSERLRRKRKTQNESSVPNEIEEIPLSGQETQEVMLETVERKEAVLEEVVKKQDDMDALQHEAVNRAVNHLRQEVEECQARNTVSSSSKEKGSVVLSPDAVMELAIAARQTAQANKAEGEDTIAKTEAELQKLQNEYDREFMALRGEIENERLRLEAKMREKLSAKRHHRGSAEGASSNETDWEINYDDGDGTSPEEELEDQLADFTEKAIEALREQHFTLQQDAEAQKSQAVVAVAVADAQIAYLDGLEPNNQPASEFSTMRSPVQSPRSRLELTGELLETLASRIPAQIEQRTQEAFDGLHANYVLACSQRRRELEADAAMRKARLAEKIDRRRREKSKGEEVDQVATAQSTSSLPERLTDEEKAVVTEIDKGLAASLAALDESERQAGKALAKVLTSTLHKTGKEVDGQLRQSRQEYELVLSNLNPGDEKAAKRLTETVVNVLDALEDEASKREKAAAGLREATEREIERLRDESSNALSALRHALDAEKHRQEQRLQQRMAQRREQQQKQLPSGSSAKEVEEMNDVIARQESLERQRLEDQLETQAQLAFDEERTKQHEHEDRLLQQLQDACVAEAAATATKEAVAQARGEYLTSGDSNDEELSTLMRLWKARQPRKASVKEASEMVVRKRSVVSRLAALAVPPAVENNTSVTKENGVADTMAAEVEQQIKTLSASHLRAWQQRHQELQDDEARRKAELETRLRRKRDAKRQLGSDREVPQQTHIASDENEEKLLHQLKAEAIERKFAMEAEVDADLEQLATAVQSAGAQSTADIENLLAVCHLSFENETAALRDALRVQRQAQQEALHQRLKQKRRGKLQELESVGKGSDPGTLQALDNAFREEEATELRAISENETQQLSALHERLCDEVGAAFAEADKKAKLRCEDANAKLAVSEDKLSSIYRDHEEGNRALRESLGIEQRRQQDKLLERMAKRRAERLAELKRDHPNDLSNKVVQQAMAEIDREHERERLRLEDVTSEQISKALQELDDKMRAKESTLQADTRRLRAEAEAAQAAREALAAAHCAEADRVTCGFYACLGDMDVEGLQAQDRRRRLEQRLASKRARKLKSSPSAAPTSPQSLSRQEDASPLAAGVLSANTQSTVVDNLNSELQRLHEEHDRDWGAMKTRLEDETRLRKAQLAEILQRKRQALRSNTSLPLSERERAEAALNREEERENLAIDASAASAARALALAIQHAKEKTADTLAGGLASSSDDLDALLEATRKQHDEAQRKLRGTLEMERRKQEQLLQDRLRQRQAARTEGTLPMLEKGSEEAEEERLKRELDEQLSAQEAQAWTALHEQERKEVEALLIPLEAALEKRLDDAELAERRAREELERLADEHDRHLAELRENLEAEKKRQQLALRDKLRRKREQQRAQGINVSDQVAKEEERQTMEALETAFEANLASMEAEAQEARREKETELLAQVCLLSASRAAEEASLGLLDAARLEAERVRAEYEAALATRRQGAAAERTIGRDEMARRLADRTLKRRQDREQRGPRSIVEAVDVAKAAQPIESTPKEPGDDGSVDRKIASVQAAHARGVKSRREQLEAETAARKAALAARLQHKRRAAASASSNDGVLPAETEQALLLEEQEELLAIERDRAVKATELEAEAAREQELLAKSVREASERGAADIERQLAACKLAHEQESARLEEALRAERARQELTLKQRLAAKQQRRNADGGNGNDEDDNAEDAAMAQEVQSAQHELEEQERAARQQLVDRQQQEMADITRKLEQDAEAQRKAAFDLQAAAEHELKRLEEEHARERRALQEALLADQQKREALLRDKLAKKKAARQAKGGDRHQDDEAGAEDEVSMAALQEEIMQEQAAALAQERERQEAALRQAAAELQDAATAAAQASAAARQAQDEAARVVAEFDRHRGEAEQVDSAEAVQSKRKLADRLAEKKRKQQLKNQQRQAEQGKQESSANETSAQSLADEAERLRLETQIEAQLAACREIHDAESAKLRESLQAERERQERALQERIARRKEKRALADAQASAKVDTKAVGEAERKQEEEEEAALAAALAAQEQEAWEAIQRKQEDDLRVLQERKQQQEHERAEHQQQLAQQEMNRLQEEHERELRALTASLAQEQARQEEKLQQRIAQRRARKQRQEEEAAAKAQQTSADAEEEVRLAAEREEAEALARAQAKEEAEAEEKERREIAARLTQKLEEERARQRREKEELEARLAREAEDQAVKRAEVLALQLQQQAIETADKMAREFDTNLRELRETHSADGAAQKARLETRIAAKKARKLRELEEKRELERQRLRARQQLEADEATKAEKERETALEEVAKQAATPVVEEAAVNQPATSVVLSPAEEKAGAMIRAARQQQQDVIAVQQLFTYGLVPLKLSLLGAVELVVGARHERESAVQLAEIAARSIENVRRALQVVTQEKAARKAQALLEISGRHSGADQTEAETETERVLAQIDAEFAERLQEADRQAARESEEAKQQAEHDLKERQMREIAYLLAHFDAQHTAALANVPAGAAQTQPVQQQQSQQPATSAAQREAENLVAELRSRLELEADERRRELEEEKRLELERLAKEEQDHLAQVEARLAALLAEERLAMTQMLAARLQALPSGKVKQRDAAEREHTAQLQRLMLMLEGRGHQQQSRVRARMAQQKVLVEDEFRRKAQIVVSVMNQRLVQEKAGLRQKQELLTSSSPQPALLEPKSQQQDTETPQSVFTAELAKHLEDVLEERLTKIEALISAFKRDEQEEILQKVDEPEQTNPKEEDGTSLISYRLAVAQAVATGCRYEKRPVVDEAEASSGLWQQEQIQILQEKLDTAEKLYLQVLRQHEQQTQTVEYWQDLLAEQRDAEYEEDAFDVEDEDEGGANKSKDDADAAEKQRQREARALEAQNELDRASQAQKATRKERDDLFAQCQQLRDQLNVLRGTHAE